MEDTEAAAGAVVDLVVEAAGAVVAEALAGAADSAALVEAVRVAVAPAVAGNLRGCNGS